MKIWIIIVILVAIGIGACVWSFVAGPKIAKSAASKVTTERPEGEIRSPRHLSDSSSILINSPDIPTYLMSGSVETRVN